MGMNILNKRAQIERLGVRYKAEIWYHCRLARISRIAITVD